MSFLALRARNDNVSDRREESYFLSWQIYKNTFKNKQKIFLFRTEIFIIFASLKIIGNF